MLNEEKVMAVYRENYEMAIQDGHQDNASKIAWEWTEGMLIRQFNRIRENHHAAQQEAINKAFYG